MEKKKLTIEETFVQKGEEEDESSKSSKWNI